ncbi:hypothetical protein F5X96DRAFT_324899 [Biscogniauxia mediterranea]|nr:hypothetical protein F5X96DRAFT_324899 [Biscogniauxia mediterranea]
MIDRICINVFRASQPRLTRSILKGASSRLQCSSTTARKPASRGTRISPLRHTSRDVTSSSTGDNKFVIPEKVINAQKVLGYEFKRPEILWEGLQAPGSDVTALNGRQIPGGNKPLAGVGDKVFALVTVLDSYERGEDIGTTSNLLRAMVSNYQLATACDNSGLTECINQNPSQVGLISPRTKADTVEAVIGAAYKDGGLDAARRVMNKLKLLKDS